MPSAVDALVLLLAFFLLRDVLGTRKAMSLASLAALCWSIYEYRAYRTRTELEHNRVASLEQLVPSHVPISSVVSAKELADQSAIPQDASYQVPVSQLASYAYIPKHPVLVGSLERLGDVRLRRAPALQVCLATLERYLQTYDALMTRKVPRIGNSRAHEVARQRLTNMHLLRQDLLEQLRTTAFEFRTHPDIDRAVASLRDYTHELYSKCARRWAGALPTYADAGMPPHGHIAYDSSEVASAVYKH
jgi:hypothetical protein